MGWISVPELVCGPHQDQTPVERAWCCVQPMSHMCQFPGHSRQNRGDRSGALYAACNPDTLDCMQCPVQPACHRQCPLGAAHPLTSPARWLWVWHRAAWSAYPVLALCTACSIHAESSPTQHVPALELSAWVGPELTLHSAQEAQAAGSSPHTICCTRSWGQARALQSRSNSSTGWI